MRQDWMIHCACSFRSRGGSLVLVREAGGDEAFEERVGCVGLRSKLGVELAGEEPGMALDFDKLNQSPVRRGAGDYEPLVFHDVSIVHVEFVAVTMSLEDFGPAIDLMSQRVLA